MIKTFPKKDNVFGNGVIRFIQFFVFMLANSSLLLF